MGRAQAVSLQRRSPETDSPASPSRMSSTRPQIPAVAFAILVALALVAAGPGSVVAQEADGPTGSSTDTAGTGTPEPLPDLVLRINLPAYELEVVEDGQVIQRYPAAIGVPEWPTPLGDFDVTRVVWNPWWHPPASAWARGERVTPPGPGNPMGQLKIQFDTYLYIHGTGDQRELGQPASHGCIRLLDGDIQHLARLLVERTGGISMEEVRALERNQRRNHSLTLPRSVRLEIDYRLAEETPDGVEVYDNPYGFGMNELEEELYRRWRALQEGGGPGA